MRAQEIPNVNKMQEDISWSENVGEGTIRGHKGPREDSVKERRHLCLELENNVRTMGHSRQKECC